ncbi:MAG: carbon storage regulator CsrA [Proteobacteria bacterium]|nr:carbon storage regulator CsrA [Pseudomonadota bacterium]MYJ94681.1 carbon storage regulator CsrA [Pseudomonadota bacterium]
MLILTRRIGEAFVIGSDITISVVGVKGNQVRLGIDAPEDVSVFRAEIAERMRREKASLEAAENDAASA